MTLKNALTIFNRPNSLLVITSYPEKGVKYSDKQDAVAGFAKNRVLPLAKKLASQNRRVVILTNFTHKPETYVEDGILIIRCFQRHHFQNFIALTSLCYQFNYIKNVLIEFEFSTFGDTLSTLFVPPFLLGLKLMNKRVFIELHQVLTYIDKISGHIGQCKHHLKTRLLGAVLKTFYQVITRQADHIIVLEDHLQTKLTTLTHQHNISVIPHGVDKQITQVDQSTAKQQLGFKSTDYLVVCFGYITWYKGSDFIIKSFLHSPSLAHNKNVHLIMAGGPSFTQSQKPHYRRYFQSVTTLVGKHTNVHLTGFVPEDQIKTYYAAADLIVLPYRTFMSSSGPLSLALSYQKPFILSHKLTAYSKSADFAMSMEKTNTRIDDLVFHLSQQGISQSILKVKNSRPLQNQLTQFSTNLSNQRSFTKLADKYIHLFSMLS